MKGQEVSRGPSAIWYRTVQGAGGRGRLVRRAWIRSALHGLANQLGLGNQVEFTGHLDDVGPVLSETASWYTISVARTI